MGTPVMSSQGMVVVVAALLTLLIAISSSQYSPTDMVEKPYIRVSYSGHQTRKRSSAAGSGYLLPTPPTSDLLLPSPGRRGGLLYPPPPDNLLQASPGQLLPGGHGLLFSLPWLAREPQQEQPQPPDSNG